MACLRGIWGLAAWLGHCNVATHMQDRRLVGCRVESCIGEDGMGDGGEDGERSERDGGALSRSLRSRGGQTT